MRILLSILFCVFIANAIVPKGTIVTQSVTINSAYVSETSSHFLLQFKVPRTGLVAANCDSAKHVAMTGSTDTVRVPRWVVFTTDTLFIYADGAVNNGLNTQYNMHFGKALNEVNASSTFTNCGITNFLGMDEVSGVTTVVDYASGANGTLTSPAEFGTAGKFGNALMNTGVGSGRVRMASEVVGANYITLELVVYPTGAGGGSAGNLFRNGAHILQRQGGDTYGFVRDGATQRYSAPNSVLYNQWSHVAVRSQSSGINIYVNGQLSGSANQVAPAPVAGPANLTIGNNEAATPTFAWAGLIDNVVVYNSVDKSANYITTRYNMLFNPSAFFTLGTPVLNELTGSRWSAYKSAFKSSYKTAYK